MSRITSPLTPLPTLRAHLRPQPAPRVLDGEDVAVEIGEITERVANGAGVAASKSPACSRNPASDKSARFLRCVGYLSTDQMFE